MYGHTKDTCYKIHGYPAGHKFHKSGNNNKRNKNNVNNVVRDISNEKNDEIQKITSSVGEWKLNKEQMNTLMSLFLGSAEQNTTHIARITCINTLQLESDLWILDSGATIHITPHEYLLKNVKRLTMPMSVSLPNRVTISVHQIGDCQLNENIRLNGVLLVHAIRFNLISVSKLFKDSDLDVLLTDTSCVI